MKPFTPWEKATAVEADAIPGLFTRAATLPLTLFCSLALAVLLQPALGLATIPVALIFGRMMALDLTTYTLPNIYTVPLVAVGLSHAMLHGHFTHAIIAFALLFFFAQSLHHSRWKAGLGGGDLKLLAALFAFLPLTSAFWAIAVGCLVYLPFACLKPKAMVPFGVPLILGWSILIAFPHLPNWVLSPIS